MTANTDPLFSHRTRTNVRPTPAPVAAPAPAPARPVDLPSGIFR